MTFIEQIKKDREAIYNQLNPTEEIDKHDLAMQGIFFQAKLHGRLEAYYNIIKLFEQNQKP